MQPGIEETRGRLYSLVVMETALDEEIERRETEHHWDQKKFVYLQALDCDVLQLETLKAKIQSSLGVINMFKYLLEETFREKMILINMLSHQSPHSTEENLPHQPVSHEHIARHPGYSQTLGQEETFDQVYVYQTDRKNCDHQRNINYQQLDLKHRSTRLEARSLSAGIKYRQKKRTSCKGLQRHRERHLRQKRKRFLTNFDQGLKNQTLLHRRQFLASRIKHFQRQSSKRRIAHQNVPCLSSKSRNIKCLNVDHPRLTAAHTYSAYLSNQNPRNSQPDESLVTHQRRLPLVEEIDTHGSSQSSDSIQPMENGNDHLSLFDTSRRRRTILPLSFSSPTCHADEIVEDFFFSEYRGFEH